MENPERVVDDSAIVDTDELDDIAALAKKAWTILQSDREVLCKVDDYVQGIQPGPYKPTTASAQYKLLIKRAQLNVFPTVLDAPARCMYIEGFRENQEDTIGNASGKAAGNKRTLWQHWQRNRLDSRQGPLLRAALQSGCSYGLVEKPIDGALSPAFKALSPLRTTSLWLDPANDARPAFVLTIDKFPNPTAALALGRGRAWDDSDAYTFQIDADGVLSALTTVAHGFAECPVVAFDAFRDLEGRTMGIVEQLIPTQDRLNQTLFDLLIAQTYGSFTVRTASGITPPPMMTKQTLLVDDVRDQLEDDDPLKDAPNGTVYGDRMVPLLDDQGNTVPAPITADATRFLVAEDYQAHFGSLPATPLGGYIESIAMSLHHVAAVGSIPPHLLLGNMANLSADALAVAEAGLFRLVQELQHSFGESWEQVFGLFAEAMGDDIDLVDAEVQWRDLSIRSFAAMADGLSKLAESMQIPSRGLWSRIPGVTAAELESWAQMQDEAIALGPNDPRSALLSGIASQTAVNSPAYSDGGSASRPPQEKPELPDPTAKA